jgi:hypothetical protein
VKKSVAVKSSKKGTLSVVPRTSVKSQDNVSMALDLLSCSPEWGDNEDDRKAEGKDLVLQMPKEISPTPTMVSMARSVFTPGKTYRLRTTRNASLTSGGAGTMQLATVVVPSGMAEYTGLTLLFNECRLHSTRISYAFSSNGTIPIIVPFVSAFDPGSAGTTPTFTYACQQVNAKLTQSFWSTGTFKNHWIAKQARPWSQTTASSIGVDPVGGSVGSWLHSIGGTTTASVVIATYLIECDYEFRNPL